MGPLCQSVFACSPPTHFQFTHGDSWAFCTEILCRKFNFLFIQFHFPVFRTEIYTIHSVFFLFSRPAVFQTVNIHFFCCCLFRPLFVCLEAWNFRSISLFKHVPVTFFFLSIFSVLMEIWINIDFPRIAYCCQLENVHEFVCRAESKYSSVWCEFVLVLIQFCERGRWMRVVLSIKTLYSSFRWRFKI